MSKRSSIYLAALGAAVFGGLGWAMFAAPLATTVVDAQGSMSVPADYRSSYEFLGTWAVASDPAQGSKELHTVYASPGTMAAFRSSGKFPHDAVLIKEVFEARTEPLTTGVVSHAEKLAGWFVMVKDDKQRFPDNKLWGEGWGWAWFDVANPNRTTSTNYKTDCIGCHTPAKKTDWVFVQGYPPLR
ncbi:MAG TPA: cytochrome P460 family protein [Ramlibacter sp.]|jgi:hypothetical protein|nr:cytochrome P460 family protein [Ramlibacter sp.]